LDCGAILATRRSVATRTARSIAQRQRICEHCGAAFVARHPSGKGRAGKVKEGRFCSRRCRDGSFKKRPTKQLNLFDPRLSKNLQGTET
jgi:hypothetical protein